MSNQITNKILPADFPTPILKAVVLRFADRADDLGNVPYCGAKAVADETGFCISAVRAAIANLREAEILTVVEIGGNKLVDGVMKHVTTTHRINMARIEKLPRFMWVKSTNRKAIVTCGLVWSRGPNKKTWMLTQLPADSETHGDDPNLVLPVDPSTERTGTSPPGGLVPVHQADSNHLSTRQIYKEDFTSDVAARESVVAVDLPWIDDAWRTRYDPQIECLWPVARHSGFKMTAFIADLKFLSNQHGWKFDTAVKRAAKRAATITICPVKYMETTIANLPDRQITARNGVIATAIDDDGLSIENTTPLPDPPDQHKVFVSNHRTGWR